MWTPHDPHDKESLAPMALEQTDDDDVEDLEAIEPTWEVDRGPRHGLLKALGAIAIGVPLAAFAAYAVVNRGDAPAPATAAAAVERPVAVDVAQQAPAIAPVADAGTPPPPVSPASPDPADPSVVTAAPTPVVEAVPVKAKKDPRAAPARRSQASRPVGRRGASATPAPPPGDSPSSFPYEEAAPGAQARAQDAGDLPYEPDAP